MRRRRGEITEQIHRIGVEGAFIRRVSVNTSPRQLNAVAAERTQVIVAVFDTLRPAEPTFGGLCDPRLLIATCVSGCVMDLRCERGRQECCWGGMAVGVGRKEPRCLDGFVTFGPLFAPLTHRYKSLS